MRLTVTNGKTTLDGGSLQPLSEWYGVTTDAGGHVAELRLNENQLAGSIPTSIAQLSNLCHLDLRGNQLFGELPTEISNLVNLQSISLIDNQLNGSIPTNVWLMPT